jgi:hypothetical protein
MPTGDTEGIVDRRRRAERDHGVTKVLAVLLLYAIPGGCRQPTGHSRGRQPGTDHNRPLCEGLVIDLSGMNGAIVDSVKRTARVASGSREGPTVHRYTRLFE